MNKIYDLVDKVYKTRNVQEIPWIHNELPKLLKKNIKKLSIPKNAEILDLGCGTGNYSLILSKDFKVIGIDYSETAIKIAEDNKQKLNSECVFLKKDFSEPNINLNKKFDLIIEWEVFHHILPEHRKVWLSNVKKHLKKNGYYISASFNKNTDYFKYVNNEWKTNIGTKLFLSSETELKKMFSQFFKIKEIKTLNLNEKYNNHLLTYLILTK